jgi:hypothetical protein
MSRRSVGAGGRTLPKGYASKAARLVRWSCNGEAVSDIARLVFHAFQLFSPFISNGGLTWQMTVDDLDVVLAEEGAAKAKSAARCLASSSQAAESTKGRQI